MLTKLYKSMAIAVLNVLTLTTAHALAQVNQPPVAMIVGQASALVGQTVIFDSGASHDPDGIIVSYIWDFGDDALSTQTEMGDSTVAYVYNVAGTYQVTLTVIDDDNLSNTATHTIVIVAPTKFYFPLVMKSAN